MIWKLFPKELVEVFEIETTPTVAFERVLQNAEYAMQSAGRSNTHGGNVFSSFFLMNLKHKPPSS